MAHFSVSFLQSPLRLSRGTMPVLAVQLEVHGLSQMCQQVLVGRRK